MAGAVSAALDRGFVFDQVVGTSAGALVGSLVAAGYGASDLRAVVESVDWPSLIDRRRLGRLPGVGPHLAMFLGRGLARGRALEETWRELLGRKGVRTFGDLSGVVLQVIATDIAHGRGVVLPDSVSELGRDPRNLSVARAVRASASVPYLFEPVGMTGSGESWVLVDGAFAARFPLQLVTPGRPTIGFRLAPPNRSHHHRIRGPIGLTAAVISAGMSARETLPVLCRDVSTIIEIEVEIAPLDFDLDRDTAVHLFTVGYDQAASFLEHLKPSHGIGTLPM